MEILGVFVLVAVILSTGAVIFVVTRAGNVVRKTSVTVDMSVPKFSIGKDKPLWQHNPSSQGRHEVGSSR